MNRWKEQITNLLSKFKMKEHQRPAPLEENATFLQKIANLRHNIYVMVALIIVAVIGLVAGGKYLIDHHEYSGYRIVSTAEQADAQSSQYMELDGSVLRYTADGASLTTAGNRQLWNTTYQMTAPVAEADFGTAVVYDERGTSVQVFDRSGVLGNFTVDKPILKAAVSDHGQVVLILEDGENTWVNFYEANGTAIAASSSVMDDPGYPVDVAVSENGQMVAVSYLEMNGGQFGTYLVFYDFSNSGRNNNNNIAAEYHLQDQLVPEIRYMSGNTAVVFGEDGYAVYEGSQEPVETERVTFDQEIVSSFMNEQYIGFVFSNENDTEPFRMELYNKNGTQRMSTTFSIPYDHIGISGDQILLYNNAQLSVFTTSGIEKFTGNLEEGNVYGVLKTGMNRYMLAAGSGVHTIKLR